MGKKHRNETKEERKARKRAKKEAKRARKAEKKSAHDNEASSTVANNHDDEQQAPATSSSPTAPVSQAPSNQNEASFIKKRLKMVVSLYPVSLEHPLTSFRESLSSLLLKYSDGMGGILFGFTNVSYSKGGMIMNELPQVHYTVELDALVFCPEVGKKITGVVNECFPSHVGMLVHRYFNAMVSSHHMQAAGYVFDQDGQQWVHQGDGLVVENDDKIEFCIEKIHECDGIISMEGSHPSKAL